MKEKITGCIVLYNNSLKMLQACISEFLDTALDTHLYLIDNSPGTELKVLKTEQRISYIHNPSNPGFGAAHNIGISKAIELGSNYHFVINPDVFFDGAIIPSMIKVMLEDSSIGMLMPQILNEDGSIQNLPKLLPSPYSLFMRKFKRPAFIYNRFIDTYELRSVDKEKIYNAPILSGCFTLLNLEAVKKIGMYDDAFFMYFEDWDLSRRMHQKYKTIYFPSVSVTHGYESGANKSSQLFKIFVKSAVTYFNKWGWFFDSERKKINKKALSQFN